MLTIQIGWVDELGSGVRNIFKYNKIYSGEDPQFIKGDIFKTIIPLVSLSNENDGEHDEILIKSQKVLEFCKEPKTRSEIQELLAIKSRPYLSQKILNPLIEKDLLLLTLPDKPTSKKQKYFTNKK